MKRRDLLVRRYWRREDDGTYGSFDWWKFFIECVMFENIYYLNESNFFFIFLVTVILYHSVFHKKCPSQKGYVRACLKSNVCLIKKVVNISMVYYFCYHAQFQPSFLCTGKVHCLLHSFLWFNHLWHYLVELYKVEDAWIYPLKPLLSLEFL